MDIIDKAISDLYDEFDDNSDEYPDLFLEVYCYLVDEELIVEVPEKECDDVTKNEWIRDNIPVMRQFMRKKNDSNME